MTKKVSIIMPAYNAGEFIEEAIQSVMNQSYTDWELIIVDDCSSDNTNAIVSEYAEKDSRIICEKNDVNSGAAVSRNRAIELATGDYMAFLDSDDVWNKDKLKKQVAFMEENDFSFTCTSYNKINRNSEDLGTVVKALSIDYEGLLKRCPGNSTVIYNCKKLGKFTIPDIKKRNDYVMWLRVIKKAGTLNGLDEVLGSHRIGIESISSNKTKLLKYHWHIYRDFEKLSWLKCCYLCCFWVAKTVFHL